MTYAEKQLAPGERILYRARYHWVFFGKAILFLVLSIAASAGALALESKGAAAGYSTAAMIAAGALLLWALVLFVWRLARSRADEFVVTDRRVLHKVGIFAHETRQCPLERIQDITVDQTFAGRLFGYGDLAIETAAERGQILFPTIAHPEALRTAIWTHVGTGGVSIPASAGTAAAPGAGAAVAATSAERLAQLQDLRTRGLITPEEFEQKRRDVLKEL